MTRPLLLIAAMLALLLVRPAFSDEPPSSPSGQGATTFTEAPAAKEEVSGLALMVAAYIAIWVLLGVYITMLLMRSRRLDGELQELRARLDQLDRAVQKKP